MSRREHGTAFNVRQDGDDGRGGMPVRTYAVIVERADHNYSAYSPDVPGCVATGRTVGDTLDRFREALIYHLEGLKDDGLPVPEPQAEVHTVALP